MRVTVKFFSYYAKVAGTDRLTVELPERANAAQLINLLRTQLGSTSLTVDRTLLIVNQTRALPETILQDGDEVAVLYLIGGG